MRSTHIEFVGQITAGHCTGEARILKASLEMLNMISNTPRFRAGAHSVITAG